MLQNPQQQMPSALWDLHTECPEPFEHNPCFRIFRRKLADDDKPAYYIKGVNSLEGWTLMLHDAATVLESYRRSETMLAMIKFLFANGRPFNTFFSETLITQPQLAHVRHSPTLGFHSQHYKPGLHEYKHYEQLVKEFCTLPRARAALTRGGIVWRLVMASIGSPAETIVSNGPSQEVFSYGRSLQDPEASGMMWDDELTEAEVDLICGVYKVSTGESIF
jgi:hypothetical protein